jgi:HlyD family secretion protein
MTARTRPSWILYALGALSIAAILAAVLVIGPASAGSSTVTRTATAANGVVQSTVSGSGNLQPASQLNLGFGTSGTVEHIYVSEGQHVVAGQLLAKLDPQSAEATLQQARASLQSAEASLAQEEETGGESSGSGAVATGASASAATVSFTARAAASSPTQPTGSAPTSTTTAPSAKTTAPTAPATKAPSGSGSKSGTGSSTAPTGEGRSSSSSSSSSGATVSAATREANLASARAAVRSDQLTVQGDEKAVRNTKLYAPETGTIASLSGEVGEVVSGGGTSKASASAESSTGASGSGGSGAASSGSSTGSGSSSSSSSFAVLTDLSTMQLVVPLSESEVGSVRKGQIATVTVEALEGRKLAAHVSHVATLSTSNSGVVSYDVTFALDQMTSGLKPGMSATGEVVVKQATGVNVPTSAISRGTITVLQGSKQVRRSVVTGLAGNSSTIILSGLKAGETVLLPSVTSSSASSSSASQRGGARGFGGGSGGLAGGGLGGGGFPGAGGGGPAIRGGG